MRQSPRSIEPTTAFRRDFKRESKRVLSGQIEGLLRPVLTALAADEPSRAPAETTRSVASGATAASATYAAISCSSTASRTTRRCSSSASARTPSCSADRDALVRGLVRGAPPPRISATCRFPSFSPLARRSPSRLQREARTTGPRARLESVPRARSVSNRLLAGGRSAWTRVAWRGLRNRVEPGERLRLFAERPAPSRAWEIAVRRVRIRVTA